MSLSQSWSHEMRSHMGSLQQPACLALSGHSVVTSSISSLTYEMKEEQVD